MSRGHNTFRVETGPGPGSSVTNTANWAYHTLYSIILCNFALGEAEAANVTSHLPEVQAALKVSLLDAARTAPLATTD